MPAGVIGREEFEQTHRCRQIEQEGPGTTYVALARISDHKGALAVIAAEVMFTRQNGLREWTVFLGPSISLSGLDACEDVVRNTGWAMLQRDGEHFFPRLPGSYYR